jgi:hypothetical protein
MILHQIQFDIKHLGYVLTTDSIMTPDHLIFLSFLN